MSNSNFPKLPLKSASTAEQYHHDNLHFNPTNCILRNLRSRFLAPVVFGLMSTVYNPMKEMETTAYKPAPKVMVLKILIR